MDTKTIIAAAFMVIPWLLIFWVMVKRGRRLYD